MKLLSKSNFPLLSTLWVGKLYLSKDSVSWVMKEQNIFRKETGLFYHS